MVDAYPPTVQKTRLDDFAAALGSSPRALRRDECNDPRIAGTRGHIYAAPEGFQLYCRCASKMGWTWAKKQLAFTVVAQDGDEEGVLLLSRLPSPDEAETIRHYLGIPKKVEYDAATLERKRASMAGAAFRVRKPKPEPSARVVSSTPGVARKDYP